ncbi:MAG: hypothetical protein KY439_06375 [Actinobacteria bacterium]|nr:hypothetical protein [Actinomycetota bacterium]
MVARVLAFVVAVAMVAGAIAYRSSREAGGNAGGGSEASVVVCASELGAVCDSITGAVIEPAGDTTDRLIAARGPAEAGLVAWLAPGPWAAMVDEARKLANKGPLFTDHEALAGTPVVAVAKKDRLPPACAPDLSWKCIAEAVNRDERFLVAADAADAPPGLFVRAAVLTGVFDQANYASNDLDQAQDLLGNLEVRVGQARARNATDLQRFLIAAPDVAVYLTTGATAGTPPPPVTVATPVPAASVDAILASAGPLPRSFDKSETARSLRSSGWAGPGTGDDGLPSPGVLLALREQLK